MNNGKRPLPTSINWRSPAAHSRGATCCGGPGSRAGRWPERSLLAACGQQQLGRVGRGQPGPGLFRRTPSRPTGRSRTGRSTSTPRTRPTTPRSTSSTRSSARAPSTSRTSRTTTRSSARCSRSSRPAEHRPRHLRADRLDGGQVGAARATASSSTGRCCPTSRPTSCRRCASARSTPRRAPGAVAVGHDRDRLQPRAGRRRDHQGRRPLGSEAEGQGHAADRDARHHRPDHAEHGPRPRQADRGRRAEAVDKLQPLRRQRPDPPLHRQRLRGDLAKGNVSPASPGRATSSSCSSTTPTSSSWCRTRAP